jgi:hypothetical protein
VNFRYDNSPVDFTVTTITVKIIIVTAHFIVTVHAIRIDRKHSARLGILQTMPFSSSPPEVNTFFDAVNIAVK